MVRPCPWLLSVTGKVDTMRRKLHFTGVRELLLAYARSTVLSCTVFGIVLTVVQPVFALQPPTPGEIERLKKEGRYEEQLSKAKSLGNHLIDRDLLEQALSRARRLVDIQQGVEVEAIQAAPPSGRKLMPTTGTVKVFALLIDFPDYPAGTGGYSTQPQIHSALFGNGSAIPANTFPYESLNNFYERSSYSQLHFSEGVTLGWYRAGYTRASMGASPTDAQREQLIKEALAAFDDTVDFTQFNNETSDNKIETFIVLWTGPDNGWSNFWWAYLTGWDDSNYTVDGMSLGKYIWMWAGDYGDAVPFEPYVAIHEMGHALGLPDYYDYDDDSGPDGGVGSLDMMHGNWGDHNSFSKWVLDWLTPTVVATGSQTLMLNPSGTYGDAVVVMPGATSTDAFREFFVVQNRYRVGNDPSETPSAGNRYPTDGMLIWHVDARLNAAGTDFKYDNSYTDHKLLKLMQADGLERIETASAKADAAMYYQPGKTLSPVTGPNSRDYLGVDSRVNVTGISQSGQQMTATFAIDAVSTLATLTVAKTGIGSGTVTGNNPAEISCGADCAESYLPVGGTLVTLTATAVPGSAFTGWSGGGCSGTGSCTVSMSANTSVTANFTTTLILDEDFDPQSSNPPTGWIKSTASGSAGWWFTYDNYNNTGGTGECALGAASGSGPYDSELRTAALNLSAYNSVGLEFKTSIEDSDATTDVDVSLNGASGPWTNVWRKAGLFKGPQTVNVDLSSSAGGYANAMLRFRHYGSGIWLILDDVKVMASIIKNDTVTVLNTSLTPSTYGQSVTLSATVSPVTATGTVTFHDGAETLGSTPVISGTSVYSTSSLVAGSHTITASYGGDTSSNPSTSSMLTQVVSPAALAVTAAGRNKVYGNPDPVLGYTASGFKNDDSLSVMSGSLVRVAGESVGSYAILQGTVSGGSNYIISYTGASLTIVTAVAREVIGGQPDVNYASLAAAVSAVPDGGSATVRLLSGEINEILTLGDGIELNLVGGYDASLLNLQAGAVTRLPGVLTISRGKLTVSGIAVR